MPLFTNGYEYFLYVARVCGDARGQGFRRTHRRIEAVARRSEEEPVERGSFGVP